MEPTRGSQFGLTRRGGRPRLRIPLSQVDVHELFKRDHDTVIAHFIERREGPLARSTTEKLQDLWQGPLPEHRILKKR